MSLVEEVARNHLVQEELDEEQPARIFGQAVESERAKRAGEEVTIAELDGQLKRRRIESIQFCLEAMETVGGADDRDRCRSADMVRSIAFGSAAQSDDREICIREVVLASGRTKEVGLDCKVGKLAKKLLLVDQPDFVFPKKQIYANGQLIEANMWKESQRRYVEIALASI